MIVNKEIIDTVLQNGVPGKKLVLSYINREGLINFMSCDIPENQMYNWVTCSKSAGEPNYKSWNNKPVKKSPAKGYLTDSRIVEIISDIISINPAAQIINELNIPDTAFCDIEVEVTDEGFPDAIHASNKVNTISWVHGTDVTVLSRKNLTLNEIEAIQTQIDTHCSLFDEKYRFHYVFHENEVDLLIDFFKNYMGTVSCISGWNFFGYDYPYLYNRAAKFGIDIMDYISPGGRNSVIKYTPRNAKTQEEKLILPAHRLIYDYMEVYAKWDKVIEQKENNKLDWVSEKALGVKKVEKPVGFKELWESYTQDYVFYNAVDSILVRELDKKLKTSNAFFSLANLLHVPALVAFSPVRSLETVQSEYLYREHKVFPNDSKKQNSENDGYEGAFVFEPKAGVYKNVIALDFASLYPSTMRQFNISPDTFLGKDKAHIRKPNEIKTVSGAIYKRDEEGFVPRILTDFYAQRKAFKKEMLIAEKEAGLLKEIYERRFGSNRL